MIGGLLVSTVLSLVFVPSFFSVMDDLSRGVAWLMSFIIKPNAKDEGDEDVDEVAPAFRRKQPTSRCSRARFPAAAWLRNNASSPCAIAGLPSLLYRSQCSRLTERMCHV